MPINFDLESLRQKYECVNYFEIGLWNTSRDVSSKRGLLHSQLCQLYNI